MLFCYIHTVYFHHCPSKFLVFVSFKTHTLSVSKTFTKIPAFTANCLKSLSALSIGLKCQNRTDWDWHARWPLATIFLLLATIISEKSENEPELFLLSLLSTVQLFPAVVHSIVVAVDVFSNAHSLFSSLSFSSLLTFLSSTFLFRSFFLFPTFTCSLLLRFSLSLFLIVAICSLLDFSIYTLIFSTSQTHIVNSIVLSRARHFLFLFSLLHHQKASIRYMVVFISTTTSTSTTLLLALFLQSNFHLLLYHLLFHLYRTSCFFVQAK